MIDDAALAISIGSLAVLVAAFIRPGRWRAQERREAASSFEVLVRPGYTSGADARLVLGDVAVIVQSTSTKDAAITELGIEPVEPPGPLTILTGYRGSFSKKVDGGSSFYYTIHSNVFAELLLSLSDPPKEQSFSIYVQSGHGSTAKCWKSAPFSVAPSELP